MITALILSHNNLELTKRCVKSVLAQDIECAPLIVDNYSTDGTRDWFREEKMWFHEFDENQGVSAGWNWGLKHLFSIIGRGQTNNVLVLGNDTVLPPWFCSTLLAYGVDFVTGTSVDDMDALAIKPPVARLVPSPDFSAFLISRRAWTTIGPFDAEMVSWASDCDYHIRGHKAQIPLAKAYVPFFHVRSRTIELAPPREKRALQLQADADRETFFEKWNCYPGSPAYAELFK